MSRILLCRTPDSRLPDLQAALLKKDYQVEVLLDPVELENLKECTVVAHIDLTIIDVTCGRDGTLSCQAFSKTCPDVPLILLIAQAAHAHTECKRLTCGNVLRLPFTPRKVINRVRKLLESHQGRVLRVGELALSPEKRCVYRGNSLRKLTPRQAQLLEVFMQHAGQTLTRKFLMEKVWETDYMGDTRTLDVHVRWIRERIEEEPGNPKYLRTVRGIGYRFADPSED